MSENDVDCKDCKRVREHIASLLSFKVVEAFGRPLLISGVAMVAGISRNFNVYTPDELAAFAEKLKAAPVYIEHVSASRAVGKVTKTAFDPALRAITYVAEIYDEVIAEKIRNGLIQHVSVGADYQVMDVVDAKVPRGLYNAELSLVAVPGVPETTIHVLEHLAAASKNSSKIKLQTKELLQDLQCVFCGAPGEYLVSVCTGCGDNAQSLVLPVLEHLPVREAEDDAPTLFSAFKVRFVAGPGACDKCKALDGKEFIYGQEPGLPHDGCKCPGYKLVERLVFHVHSKEAEKLEEKDLTELAEKLAAKLKVKEALLLKCPKCGQEFEAEQWETNGWKCPNAECGVEVVAPPVPVLAIKGEGSAAEKLAESERKLGVAEQTVNSQNKLLEKYRAVAPGVELLAEAPVLMPVAEAVADIKAVLPASMVQRSWSLGPQRMCQELHRVINKLERRAGGR